MKPTTKRIVSEMLFLLGGLVVADPAWAVRRLY